MSGGWITIAAPRLTHVRRDPLRASFLERPHRFAARCRLRGGREADAHVPNPGRLTGVLAPRCQVLLDGPYPLGRALPYTMVAAKAGGVWVCTNTLYANKVFPALVARGLFPELDGASIRAEVVHGRSRFDFDVGGTMVEVKSVTLAWTGFATRLKRQDAAALLKTDAYPWHTANKLSQAIARFEARIAPLIERDPGRELPPLDQALHRAHATGQRLPTTPTNLLPFCR